MMLTIIERVPDFRRGSRKSIAKKTVILHTDEYDVFYNGDLIGRVQKKTKFDRWEDSTKSYCIQYVGDGYNEYDDNRMSYSNDRFKTLFAAKRGVYNKWKENGSVVAQSKKSLPKYNIAELPAGDASDFYPTPMHIAGQMLSLIDMGGVTTVLEPSAGKGDLCDALK